MAATAIGSLALLGLTLSAIFIFVPWSLFRAGCRWCAGTLWTRLWM